MNLVYRLHLTALKSVILFIRMLPYPVAVRLGRLFGLIAGRCFHLHREIVRAQVRGTIAPEDEEGFLRSMFMNQGRLYVDMIRVAYTSDADLKKKIVVEGREHFEGALASGRGIMLITGHMNWEVLGHLPRVLDVEVCVMADIIKSRAIQAVTDEIRSKCRITVLPPKGGMVDKLTGELKKNRIVGMVIDQRGKRENRLFCDVLGLPAPTNPAPALIALKGEALVLPVSAVRRGDTYIFRFDKPLDAQAFGKDFRIVKGLNDCWKSAAVQKLSDAMQSWISSVVRNDPDQWFWLHCRWLRRSDMARAIKSGLDFRSYVLSQADDYILKDNVL